MVETLKDKVAVITGASSGIGRSIAERYLAEGAKVVLFARTAGPMQEIAATAPERTLVVTGDVTEPEDISRLVAAAVERFGAIDIVVPNAGIARAVPFAESNRQALHQQFAVNVLGAAETVRQCLPHVRRGGAVLFITTFLTQVGFPGLSVYSASKAAVKSLSQTLAAELAPAGIRVNAIAPGPIATPIWGSIGLPDDVLQQVAGQVTARLMPGKFGDPADIAEAAVFLASDKAKNIYGQEIVVDGGYTIG
ncbi:MAG: SDR family NAD(P)-dependent oxidoreductase [Solirubrobacterales bacterium]